MIAVVSIGAGVFLVANGSGGSKLFWAVGARVCKVANCSCVGAAANGASSGDGADDGKENDSGFVSISAACCCMRTMRNTEVLSQLN